MKKFLLWGLVIVAVAAAFGIYKYNQSPKKAEDITAVAITADSLYSAFAKDETWANKNFLNKVFDVSGTVQEVTTNQDGFPVLILGVSDDPLSGIQCSMRDANSKAEVGSQVKVKGFCNGYTLTVILSDCILIK